MKRLLIYSGLGLIILDLVLLFVHHFFWYNLPWIKAYVSKYQTTLFIEIIFVVWLIVSFTLGLIILIVGLIKK